VTVGGENLVSKTSQLRHTSSQTWQERRSSGKRGKRDVWKTWQDQRNVARPTLTWQEIHQRGKTNVIGQHDFFFFCHRCTIGQSLHAQTVRRHADAMFLMQRLVFVVVVVLSICRRFRHFCNHRWLS
jgi:hypothetical protein